MRSVIVTGGPLKDEAAGLIRKLTGSEDSFLIACDGGCDFLARYDIVPDIVVGDMDSISDEGLEFIEKHDVFIERYPVEKDWTDTEIALNKTEGSDVFLIAPVSGRIDHVIANMQLVLKLRGEGRQITMTDGITYCYPLCGDDSVEIDVSSFDEPIAVSLIPWDFGSAVKGVTTQGLYYPLEDHDLVAGPSFSFSNHPVSKNAPISITIRDGRLFAVVTFAN